MSDTNQSLVQFQELPAIVSSAPEVLEKNTKLLNMAIGRGTGLLDTIDGDGMNPEIDAECNKFLATCSEAVKRMNERRSPITKMLTAVQKEFTRLENDLDVTKAGTIPYKIQQHRDNLAREQEAIRRKKLEEEKQKQFAAEETIRVKAMVETRVRERFNANLMAAKQKAIDIFNGFNDVKQESEIREALNAIPVTYPRDKFELIDTKVTAIYIKPEELAVLIFTTKMSFYDELNADYNSTMSAHKMNLIDQIPARKQEIKDIAAAGKAEKERLEKEAKRRQEEEATRLQREELERQQAAAKAVEHNIHAGQAQVLFDQDIAKAEIVGEATQAVKEFYIIEVKTAQGWMMVINLWFKYYGGKTAVEKIGTKKPESMKKDLETLAFNGGERLADSSHLEYVSDVKALTKKS
jgi:hypothetical protein